MTEKNRPIALTVAVILVWLEAAASLTYGVLQLINLLTHSVLDLGGAISVVAFAFMISAWLFYSATRLLAGKRWARSAAIFWQLMQIAVATATFDPHFGNIPVGILVIAPAAVILVLLFMPTVVKFTTDEPAA